MFIRRCSCIDWWQPRTPVILASMTSSSNFNFQRSRGRKVTVTLWRSKVFLFARWKFLRVFCGDILMAKDCLFACPGQLVMDAWASLSGKLGALTDRNNAQLLLAPWSLSYLTIMYISNGRLSIDIVSVSLWVDLALTLVCGCLWRVSRNDGLCVAMANYTGRVPFVVGDFDLYVVMLN